VLLGKILLLKRWYFVFIIIFHQCFSSKTVQVILGKTNKNRDEISLLAKSITVHPDFKAKEELHDLAVIEIPGVQISRRTKV
jgi:Trypsin